MARVTMKQIHEMRDYILHGLSVNSISEIMNIPSNTIRLYTKAERETMKTIKMQKKNNTKVSIGIKDNKDEQLEPNITNEQNKFIVTKGTQIDFFDIMKEA